MKETASGQTDGRAGCNP